MGQHPFATLSGEVSRVMQTTSVLQNTLGAMAEKDPEVIDIRDNEEEEDWPDTGPVNVSKAKRYIDKINDIFDNLSDLLHEGQKDDQEFSEVGGEALREHEQH